MSQQEERAWRTGAPVTYALIAANTLIFLATAASSPQGFMAALENMDSLTLLHWGAKYGPLIWEGEYWRLAAAMFLHGGILHLAFNMYALLALGPPVEQLYGKARFLLIYLVAGIAGDAASLAFNQGLSIGASGAIFGLFGALLYVARRVGGQAGRQLWGQLLPPLIINLAYGLFNPVIDMYAHLGGLVGGAAMAYVASPPAVVVQLWSGSAGEARRARRMGWLWRAAVALALAAAVAAAALHPHGWYGDLQRGNRLYVQGRYAAAAKAYQSALDQRPDLPSGYCLAYYNQAMAYLKLGQPEQAKQNLEKVVQIDPGFDGAQILLNQLRTASR